MQVLRNLPFMEELPDRFFNQVVAKGLLMRYSTNEVIWMPPEEAGDDGFVGGGAPCEQNGIFIVIAGLVSRSFKEADGQTEVSPPPPPSLLHRHPSNLTA